MTLLVALTGGFGLLASFTLLQLGVHTMPLRYPLALSFAYLFFLFLIWLWLRTQASDYLDAPDVTSLIHRPDQSPGLPDFKSGGGGDFGGGGASGSFDGAATSADASEAPGKLVGKAAEAVSGGDDLAIPLVIIAMAVGISVASLYVVYIAPALFAEVLVDGALSYALVRHLRGQAPRHWLSSAFRHTVIPFAATAVFLLAVGTAMTIYAPGAVSIGQVIEQARVQRTTN